MFLLLFSLENYGYSYELVEFIVLGRALLEDEEGGLDDINVVFIRLYILFMLPSSYVGLDTFIHDIAYF